MKKFVQAGISKNDIYIDVDNAITGTYTDNNPHLISKHIHIPFAFPDNPFNNEVLNAKNILEIGAGCGRNVPWLMENTKAKYFGIEPNLSMSRWFYDHKPERNKIFKEEWRERIYITDHFDEVIKAQSFDLVIETFVFMHIGFRTPDDVMNVADITNEIKKYTAKGAIWISIAHDSEEGGWIERWLSECDLKPTVYERNYTKVEEMTYRGGHHLIIIKL